MKNRARIENPNGGMPQFGLNKGRETEQDATNKWRKTKRLKTEQESKTQMVGCLCLA